jgi:membrane-associated phospholipid phosphatase
MFQTDFILFLQSFASDTLTGVVKFIAKLGAPSFTYPGLIILVLFGANFRIGLISMHVMLWSNVFTDIFKEVFSLPRPVNVDGNVQLLGKQYPNPTPFKNMGATRFFGCLPGDVVQYFRANRIDSFGFPSGHCSGGFAYWGSVLVSFKEKWAKGIALWFILFIPFSRMYLGRHFPADILGSLGISAVFILVFFYFFRINSPWSDRLFTKAPSIKANLPVFFWGFYLFVLPFILLLVPFIEKEDSGVFLGMNAGVFCLWMKGLPESGGTWRQRLARVVTAAIVYYGIKGILDVLSKNYGMDDSIWIEWFNRFLSYFLLIWGSTEISIKLGFFKRHTITSI